MSVEKVRCFRCSRSTSAASTTNAREAYDQIVGGVVHGEQLVAHREQEHGRRHERHVAA
jgi:hypothetical protein